VTAEPVAEVDDDDRAYFWDALASRQEALEPAVTEAASEQDLDVVPGREARRRRLMPHHLFEKAAGTKVVAPIPLPSIVDVDVHQSLTQKARGVFSVRVHIQRSHRVEIVTMDDIPDGHDPQAVPHEKAHYARHARREAVPIAPATPTAAGASSDPLEQLRRLGELRDAGLVTDAEFAATKAEVLRRL
jgi:hypothetical protein